jgi:glutamate formiminotransferase/formiminotetrahydrofolate cyclodeaminase
MNFEHQAFRDFRTSLASDAPTPGGGTASAAAGAMGAALLSMVLGLTLGKEKFAAVADELRPIGDEADRAGARLEALMNEDAASFDAMVAARKLPKETEGEKAARSQAMQDAARHAAEVPMETARCAATLLSRVPLVAEKGNPNAASDAGVAALLLAAAAEGALLNVGINLGSIKDPAVVQAMEKETARISGDVERLRAQVIALVRKTFAK